MGELEQQFVRDAFDSNYIAQVGPQVDAFEKAFSWGRGLTPVSLLWPLRPWVLFELIQETKSP